MAKTSELKGIFLPVTAPVGGPVDAVLKTDPYARPNVKLTPSEWVRDLVVRKERLLRSTALPIHVPSTNAMAEAATLDTWLRNGTVGLSATEMDVVLAALVRDPSAPVDALETAADRRQRDSELSRVRGQILMDKLARQRA